MKLNLIYSTCLNITQKFLIGSDMFKTGLRLYAQVKRNMLQEMKIFLFFVCDKNLMTEQNEGAPKFFNYKLSNFSTYL